MTSSMSISKEQVHKVALLARLDLNSDELETMTEQLGQIVDYVNLLSELDTEARPTRRDPASIAMMPYPARHTTTENAT